MKRLVSVCLLMMLCLFALPALSEAAQPCYWQLTDVSVTQKALDALGPAAVSTNAEALADLKPIDMIEALSQPHTFSVDVTRAASGSNAHADYALSGMPALVPGAGSARLSLTSATVNPTSSFYVYASVYASKARVLRVRSTGACRRASTAASGWPCSTRAAGCRRRSPLFRLPRRRWSCSP